MMPDELKKHKQTHSEKKKREQRNEKWKTLKGKAKAQKGSFKESKEEEEPVISPPILRRSTKFNKKSLVAYIFLAQYVVIYIVGSFLQNFYVFICLL